ncbi:MAG: hypothetical protein M3133_07000 [Actinomycetota bacterium]|nr:hypothetical protein [Actinomycetota bacterium]
MEDVVGDGPKPGESFPDFELRTVAGERIQKADYTGRRPLLLVGGSMASKPASSAASALRRLYDEYGDRVAFVTLYLPEDALNQHHAGPEALQERLARARGYQFRERIPWTVAVDDVEGRLGDALAAEAQVVYLMARDGTVSFRAPDMTEERLLRDALRAVTAEQPKELPRDALRAVTAEQPKELPRDALRAVTAEQPKELPRDARAVTAEQSKELPGDVTPGRRRVTAAAPAQISDRIPRLGRLARAYGSLPAPARAAVALAAALLPLALIARAVRARRTS